MNKLYLDIADATVNEAVIENQGNVNVANFALSNLLIQTTDMKMFLISTGKWHEYKTWIIKFKKKYSGIENLIKNNLELEEE